MLGKSTTNPLISQVNSRPVAAGDDQSKHLPPGPGGAHSLAATHPDHPEDFLCDRQKTPSPLFPRNLGVNEKGLKLLAPSKPCGAEAVARTRGADLERKFYPVGSEFHRKFSLAEGVGPQKNAQRPAAGKSIAARPGNPQSKGRDL
jgi:hypothetical protein